MIKPKNIIFDLQGVLFERNPDQPHLYVPIAEGMQLLKECSSHKAGHTLFVCSNMKAMNLEHIYQNYGSFMQLFTGVVTPENAPGKKPDPEIFLYLLEKYGLLPEESLFLDDQEVNVSVAQSLGITGIQVINFDKVRQALTQLRVLD